MLKQKHRKGSHLDTPTCGCLESSAPGRARWELWVWRQASCCPVCAVGSRIA